MQTEMKIIGVSLDNNDRLTTHVGIPLIEYMNYFVKAGVFASKAEMIRSALRDKIVQLLKEDALLADFRETKQFNDSQKKEVIVDGHKYTVVKRLE